MSATYAMSYRASDTIASAHPELASLIRSLDRLLYDLGEGALVRVESTADHLGVDPATLERLLDLYAAQGVVEGEALAVCPEDRQILEPNAEGVLWCDVCEGEYEADEYETEISYRLRPGLKPSPPALPGRPEKPPPLAAVRDLLVSAFTAEDFRRLFLYTSQPELRRVLGQFSPNDGLEAMVDKAVEVCDKRDLLRELLQEVEAANPRRYEEYRDRLGGLA